MQENRTSMRLAKNYIRSKKAQTSVHALVYIDKKLKDWVDYMLLNEKTPYWITKELNKQLGGHVENWQIPSRKSVATYRDKYFYKSPFVYGRVIDALFRSKQ